MNNKVIRLALDITDYSEPLPDLDTTTYFWQRFERVLVGKTLPAGSTLKVRHPTNGTVGVSLIEGDSDVVVSSDVRFAVMSILDAPGAKQYCASCRDSQVVRPGDYDCPDCKAADSNAGCCDNHVVILEGGLQSDGTVRSSCEKHVPECAECKTTATFWCSGPQCRGTVAWCASHRRTHRTEPNIGYCPTCYDSLYPQCSVPGCDDPGTNRCEHVDHSSGAACGIRLCNRHIARWQVYGPSKLGLARCNTHRSLKALTDEEVTWQLVAGTALRRMSSGSSSHAYSLPTLSSLAHVLRNNRGYAYDCRKAKELFETARRGGPPTDSLKTLSAKMKNLLTDAAKRWPAELKQKADNLAAGLPFLELLRRALVRAGHADIAATVTHTAYIPPRISSVTEEVERPGMLFIRVPESMKDRIENLNGRPRRDLCEACEAAGCRVLFEKQERRS